MPLKNQKIIILFITVLLGTVYSSFAQHKVVGTIVDSVGRPIKDVSVRLYSPQDTQLSISNVNGVYQFNLIKESNVHLSFSMIGYLSDLKTHTLTSDGSINHLPPVILHKISYKISDVSITKVVPMVINGDTLQFNLGAFSFRKKSLLEDGLKKLPGFQISRDGTVYFNGYHIKKVKVNNDEFFGGDILTATKNLPVDYIQNIQLIELNSSNLSSDNGIVQFQENEKILNINLKEDKKILHFGQVTAGSGTDKRYLGSFGLNRFNNGNELSILGSFNNTNTNLFSYGDIGGGKRSDSSLEIDEFIDPIDGLNTTSSLAINLARKLGKYSRINTSYNFIEKNTDIEGFSNLKSSYIGNTIVKSEEFENLQKDINHKVRILLDSKFENNDVLRFEGNLTYNRKNILNKKESTLSNAQITNRGRNIDSLKQSLPMADVEALYVKQFRNKDRKLIGKVSLKGNEQRDKEYVDDYYSVYSKLSTDIADESAHQYVEQANSLSERKLNLSYVEPFLKNGLFEFSYEFDQNKIDVRRYVYAFQDEKNGGLIDSLLLDYGYQFRRNKMGVVYQYNPSKRLKFNLGFAMQPIKMYGSILNDTSGYVYDNISLVPSTNFIYKFSNNVDFQFSYRGKNNQPSFFQIAPVNNTTNSRSIIIGNPELRAELAHSLSTTIRTFLPSRMQYLETNFSYNYVRDKIVTDKKPINNSTVQQTTYRNTSGYYDWKFYYIFNTPLGNDNLQMDLNGGVDYYNNLSFIEDRLRTTKQYVFNQSLQFKYAWSDYLETIFKSDYTHNKAQYDIPFRTKINVETLFLGLGAKGYIKDNFSMGFEMSQRYNDGYINKFMNVNQTMMNSFIEFSFLQNRTALLRLQAYDLFDQNKHMGIYSEYVGNDVFEERKNRLGRYFMLSLNVRLQK